MDNSGASSDFIDALLRIGCLATALLTQALALAVFYRLRRESRVVASAVLLILNINIALQFSLPIAISYLRSFELETGLGIAPADLLKTLVLHALYVGCFLFAFTYKLVAPATTRDRARSPPDGAAISVFLLAGIYVLFGTFSVAGYTQTLEQLAAGSDSSLAFPEVFAIYLQTMFEWTSIVGSVYFLVSYKGRWRTRLKLPVVAYILTFVARLLALGIRGGILTLTVLGLFFLYLETGKIRIWFASGLLVVLFPFFSYLGAEYREGIKDEFLAVDTVDRLRLIVSEAPSAARSFEGDGIVRTLDAVYLRLESARNSVSLVRLQDRGMGSSLVPTLGSLLAVIPSRLWPDKGYFPASGTDNVFGTAMYVVKRETYGFSDMGPYLASAHEYWEFGLSYVVLSGLLLGLLWRALVQWAVRSHLNTASLLAIGCLLDAHHGELAVLAPLALVIKVFWYQGVPLAAVLFLLTLFRRIRFSGDQAPAGQPP